MTEIEEIKFFLKQQETGMFTTVFKVCKRMQEKKLGDMYCISGIIILEQQEKNGSVNSNWAKQLNSTFNTNLIASSNLLVSIPQLI